MDRFKHNKRVAALLGILVAVGPVLWLTPDGGADRELPVAAAWTSSNLEVQLGRVVSLLDRAAGADAVGCADPAGLQRLVRNGGLIKDIAIVGPDGEVQCNDRGTPTASSELLASIPLVADDLLIDLVRAGEGDAPMLRLRRPLANAGGWIAASVPAEALLPQLAPDGGPFVGLASITLRDGTMVAAVETPMDAETRASLIAGAVMSETYGLEVTVATARPERVMTVGGLLRGLSVAAAVTGAGLLLAAAIAARRRRGRPFYDIERAIGAGEFVPFYQPIVDITNGTVVGAEVLIRWRKRDGTLVLPGSFIPFIEPTDAILDMTRAVMRRVCDDIGSLLQQHPHLYVGFNIAPRHLDGDILIDDIGSIFLGGPISTSQIVLEITERYEIKNLVQTRKLIAELQGLGCRIAIDDVGTGHNGLSYILKLGVDIIKIDKMFVDAIRTEAHCRAIVDTLVDLARNLRMQIVAEGVETFEQVTFLRDRGISSAQGFVFAPPLPASAFHQLIEAIDTSNTVKAGSRPERNTRVNRAA